MPARKSAEEREVCVGCLGRFPRTEEFWPKKSSTSDGLHCRCKPCFKVWNYDYIKMWRATPGNRDTERERRRSHETYHARRARENGWNLGEIEALEAEADGLCMVCGSPERARSPSDRSKKKRLALDHDHATNQLRGFLCGACNATIERFDNVPDFAVRVAAYIARAEERLRQKEASS